MEISKSDKTALLFGATGLVGKHVLEMLLWHGAYAKVHTFGRRTLQMEHPRLVHHLIDFNRLMEVKHLLHGDDLYLCLGTTRAKAGSKEAFYQVDYTWNLEIARMACDNGVNQLLLVSSVGADPTSRFFYTRVKGQLEEAVKQLPFWAVHIFQPSVLLGERNENRWGEAIAGKLGKLIDAATGGLLKKYRPVEADVVARAMVSAAQRLEPGIHVYPSHWLQELAEAIDRQTR